MARPRLIAALAAVLLCLLPAAADARSVTLEVIVSTYDETDGLKSSAGTKVEVKDMQGNKLGSGTTDAGGGVTITFELPDDQLKVLVDTDAKGADGRSTYAVAIILLDNPASVYTGLVVGERRATVDDLVQLAKVAIAQCDKAAYDRWVQELNDRVADLEMALDQKQQEADSHARNSNLRVTDVKGANKDLKRAKEAQAKLDPSLRNEAVLQALERYTQLLSELEQIKRDLPAARKARESVPPFPEDCKKDKVGLVPGVKTCPDGSGGLLAGALNEVFDSEIDPACDDETRRRDTDRPKKKKREHEEHRRD